MTTSPSSQARAPRRPLLKTWLRSYFHRELAHVLRRLCVGDEVIVQVGGDGDVAARMDKTASLVTDESSKLPSENVVTTDLTTFEGVDELSPATVLIPDALPRLKDVQATLECIGRRMESSDRLMITCYSSLWDGVYRLAERLRLKSLPRGRENWVNATDLENFLRLAGFQVVRTIPVLLCPVRLPPIDWLLNRIVVRLPLIRHLAMAFVYVARKKGERRDYSISFVIPARNERDNLKPLIEEIPPLGTSVEVIIVEGHSNDGTYEKALELAEEHQLKVAKQTGIGKADAVKLGFEMATGELLFIYDADRTVPMAEVVRFYEIVASGEAEFANGTRLVYPLEDDSMRFFNKLGNRAFTMLLAYILDYPIRDTLCGTKVLFRRDYVRLRALMDTWTVKDPFGDFDLLFGARQLNLAVIDVPIHYKSRRYGSTNILRWTDGFRLARLCAEALRRMVFFI